jgi:predicted transcriptional regulator
MLSVNEIDSYPSDDEIMARVAEATACLNVAQRACKHGLKSQHYLVLAALVETAALIDGEPNTALAIWEVSKRTALSNSQVKAAMAHLTTNGFIGRKQTARKAGVVAVTVVSRAAYELFGISGGAAIGGEDLPAEFGPLLVGEAEQTIQAIALAYRNGEMPLPDVASAFRGGAHAWLQIEFLLRGRLESAVMENTQNLADAEEKGSYIADLHDGLSITIQDPDQSGQLCYAQSKFARDVLSRVNSLSPNAIGADFAASLAAEIMYTRAHGFVRQHDYEPAMRIVASLIVRGTWSTPHGMPAQWYSLVSPLVSVKRSGTRGAQLNS